MLRRATVRHQQLLRLKQSLEDGMSHV